MFNNNDMYNGCILFRYCTLIGCYYNKFEEKTAKRIFSLS